MEEANGGEAIDRLTLWEAAHKKKDGSYINEATKDKAIEAKHLKETLMQNPEVDTTFVMEEVFKKIMGPERGYVRGIGVGLSPTEYFRMKSNKNAHSNENSSINQIASLMKNHEKEIAALNENRKMELVAINEQHKMEVEKMKAFNKKKDKRNKKKHDAMQERLSHMEENQVTMIQFLSKMHPKMLEKVPKARGNNGSSPSNIFCDSFVLFTYKEND